SHTRKPKKAASVQREMLLAIAGKREGKAKAGAKKTKRPTQRWRGQSWTLIYSRVLRIMQVD
ncbi:MAG TPA: hypothetical protein VF396_24050, partial [Bradyrhizobium sp.]